MLFVLTGSSAAGKSAVLPELAVGVDDVVVHDFDEIGVPPNADTRWRQQASERWVQRVLEMQRDGHDRVLASQTALGEWLAVPSARQRDGIAACLLDVDEFTRRQRLDERRRDGGWPSPDHIPALFNWARWHRQHAADPACRQEVIRQGAWGEMRWDRWGAWRRGDPRWDVLILDTSRVPIAVTVDQITSWISRSRRRHRAGSLPLSGDWAKSEPLESRSAASSGSC
jgi:hypothetical protein